MQRIVDRKIKVDATRAMGLYPTSQEIESYVKEQREMSKDNADFKSLLGGWSISESKYYNLMTPIWADSIVIDKWYKQVVLQNISKPDDPEKG
ncbi:Trigger factor/SurA domain [Syntrophomonas zehnderi OL-4]|uniref:Trigger factor/SurA domain n=1 Tax=Syntrophomonas zehnderi OL-4 TaxID=690567 RepID=A0A0E4C9T6_9FIRM|nr:Trigger factor/SurA domain [Syntrophomonas zehnderi OL-4]